MSANGDGQGPAQGQAQGAAAAPIYGTPGWVVRLRVRQERANLAALEARARAQDSPRPWADPEPELPPSMTPWEVEELARFEDRNDEELLTEVEAADYAFVLNIKLDYEERLAAYRAYFGLPAIDDVNEDDNNE